MRYEIMWKREQSLSGEIKKAREGAAQVQDLGDVASNLCSVMKALRCWSFDRFSAVTKELENIKG
jgi:hypothetical protein